MAIDLAFWIKLGIGILLGIITLVVFRTGGYAPGWQLRCAQCGHSGDAGKAGVIRLWASSKGKVVKGRCSQCGGDMLVLERKPQEEA